MDILANFLGHDIQVHRQYYKVLIAREQGQLSDFQGMSLDQIQMDPNEEVSEAMYKSLSNGDREGVIILLFVNRIFKI